MYRRQTSLSFVYRKTCYNALTKYSCAHTASRHYEGVNCVNIKDWIKLSLLAGACIWYIHYLYTNPKGIFQQRQMIAENTIDKQTIHSLIAEIDTLKQKTTALQSDSFEREKIIREDLQMSCTNEYVYLLPKT
ncbi:hypothetical protein FJ364_01310 [Candidatus Dependentiae bacterium]|nr:hypothetical protein [Candidatus Dependentiae bacterium]